MAKARLSWILILKISNTPDHLLSNRSLNIGPLISCELDSSKIAGTKALEPLKS
jgi:hypothetical protein